MQVRNKSFRIKSRLEELAAAVCELPATFTLESIAHSRRRQTAAGEQKRIQGTRHAHPEALHSSQERHTLHKEIRRRGRIYCTLGDEPEREMKAVGHVEILLTRGKASLPEKCRDHCGEEWTRQTGPSHKGPGLAGQGSGLASEQTEPRKGLSGATVSG